MSITSKIHNLIDAANTTTKRADTDLTSAVQSLINGYGGSSPDPDQPTYKNIDGHPYRRIFYDDFDNGDIDYNYWSPDYHLSTANPMYLVSSDLRTNNSLLHIRLKSDKPARKSTDSYQTTSGIVSSVFNDKSSINTKTGYHDFRPWYGFISQEGYYELRAKVFPEACGHSAWWGMGVDKSFLPNSEIDFFEISGKWKTRMLHNIYGHAYSSSYIDNTVPTYQGNYYHTEPLSNAFHTYGCLWENGIMKWYLDGTLIDTVEQNTPQYPFYWIINAYRAVNGQSYWAGDYDPSIGDADFIVDYFSVYKKATTQTAIQPTIVSYSPTTLSISSNVVISDDDGRIESLPPYVYVNWSDGSRTEHWVKWDIYDSTKAYNIRNGILFDWYGVIYDLGTEISIAVQSDGQEVGFQIAYDLGAGVILSNNSTSAISGSSYTTTITVDSYNYIDRVSVTMGGVDITSTAYSGNTISIPSVEADISITIKTLANSYDTSAFSEYSYRCVVQIVGEDSLIMFASISPIYVQVQNSGYVKVCLNYNGKANSAVDDFEVCYNGGGGGIAYENGGTKSSIRYDSTHKTYRVIWADSDVYKWSDDSIYYDAD